MSQSIVVSFGKSPPERPARGEPRWPPLFQRFDCFISRRLPSNLPGEEFQYCSSGSPAGWVPWIFYFTFLAGERTLVMRVAGIQRPDRAFATHGPQLLPRNGGGVSVGEAILGRGDPGIDPRANFASSPPIVTSST